MIGQKKLLSTIELLTEKNSFPRFSIIVGNGRCGKKTVSAHIATLLSAPLVVLDGKIETIREAINLSYRQGDTTVYLIPDADKISLSAKNALLKITEEPPRKAYFILTLQNQENTLETLRSRGTIFHIDAYSPSELAELALLYIPENKLLDGRKDNIIQICTCPGDIIKVAEYADIIPLYKYAEKVVTSIGKAAGANALKIGTKLAYKEDDKGWDCILFLRTVIILFSDFIIQEKAPAKHCLASIHVVSSAISDLELSGINKAATIDIMILDLRRIWVDIDD